CQAKYSRYRAPHSLSTVNAVVEAAKTAARPTATAAVWPISPVHKPNTTNKPDVRPNRADCVKTNRLSGPGVRASTIDMPKNEVVIMDASLVIPSLHGVRLGRMVFVDNVYGCPARPIL